MIKLALTDLDDTLIPYGAPCASETTRGAIHDMLDRGLHFGPVSGRPPAAMSWMFPDDEACCATGAFANGQLIRIDGETVCERRIPHEALAALAERLEDTRCGFLTLYDRRLPELVSLTPGRYREETRPGKRREGWQVVDRLPEGDQLKCNVQFGGSYDEMLGLYESLRREVDAVDFVLPSQVAVVIDILPKGWGKGPAVRYLAGELGLSLDEVAVFGDSDNDLSMIEAVPNSVAVANAAAAIREAARWHIGAASEEAVAQALRDIAEAATTGKMPAFMHG